MSPRAWIGRIRTLYSTPMSFFRTPLGTLVAVVIGLSTLVVTGTFVQVYRAMHPPRDTGAGIDFESMKMRVQEVQFTASDGVSLSGWYLAGEPGRPTLILCHDRGSDRSSLTHLAISLKAQGYNLLMFDFRGHGESAGGGSTLGLEEKRDVVGAVDWLSARGIPPSEVGLYGVGMGAFAALLASEDRARIKVLVLDGIYPSTAFALERDVFAGSRTAGELLGFLPRSLFVLASGRQAGTPMAAEVMAGMRGRNVLLLAPDSDADLCRAMQEMLAGMPQDADSDGSLLILPSTQSEGLFGRDLTRYYQHVAEFFQRRLDV